MALSVLDIYRDLLPKTNCRECGFPTCLAFAGMVVSEGLPVERCPHVDQTRLESAQAQLNAQRKSGKWIKRDISEDALRWAKERAASMSTDDLHRRIGGTISEKNGARILELPYFTDTLCIAGEGLSLESGRSLSRWEQVFLYNHLAQGGSREPTGTWKGLVDFPNTVSKIKTMEGSIERPIADSFKGRRKELLKAALSIGGKPIQDDKSGANAAMLFWPLPRIPIMLLFWDEDRAEGYGARVKFLFDETVIEHLDIESILFLCERIRQLLCGPVAA